MPLSNKSIVFLLLFIFISLTGKSQIVDYFKIDSFTVNQLQDYWKKNSIPKFITPIRYDIDIYDITYMTTWVDGTPIKATGLYFVPKKKGLEVPTLIYNHGTIVNPKRHIDYNGESTICKMFATDGYAVIAPDYIGLGRGEKQHLYHHADSEANAGIDFLKVIDEFNEKLGIKRNEQLFISGYSQGGHATMSVHRKLQDKHKDEYPVTATSPMSGAYDLSGVQAGIMEIEYSQPHYLPYLFIGYNVAYNAFPKDEFWNVFEPPYDSLVQVLFDLSYTREEVNHALPEIPKKMIRKEIFDEYKNNPDYFFTKLLEQNNMYDWKPEAPVQLCYCEGDEEVLYQNSIKAYEHFKENGVERVLLRHVGKKFNHRQCADYAVVYTKFFFDSFRKGSKKGRKGPIFKRWLIGIAKKLR